MSAASVHFAGSIANNDENAISSAVALRTCRVCCCDLKGVEQVVEVTADSLMKRYLKAWERFAITIGSMMSVEV
jgi:hypothetical protein